jgi:hypothetical protein
MDLRGVKNWKLKLRYGRAETQFCHFAIVADGEVLRPNADFQTYPGPALLTMRLWASDADQAIDMVRAVGQHLGFASTGKVYVYDAEAGEPPGDKPYCYDLKFKQYERD